MAQIITPYPVISSSTIPISTVISSSALLPTVFNPFIVESVIPTTLISNPYMPNPIIQTIGLSPVIPAFPNVVTYQDVNNDRNLKSQVLEYFYNKLLNNWLKYHFIDLYQMLIVSSGKVMLVKNMNDIDNNKKNDKHDNDIKYEYLVDNYLRKKDMYSLLSKFRKMNNLNWWELKEHSEKVRMFIHHKVKQYIKYEIIN
jgi:hypothetical protein